MSTILKLRLAVGVLDAVLKDCLRTQTEGVHEADGIVLAWLMECQVMSASDLAWRCGRDRSSMQRTLGRMARQRWVERVPSAFTGKTVGWSLTPYGEVCARQALDRLADYDFQFAMKTRGVDKLADDLMEALMAVVRPFERGAPFGRLQRPPRKERGPPEWDP